MNRVNDGRNLVGAVPTAGFGVGQTAAQPWLKGVVAGWFFTGFLLQGALEGPYSPVPRPDRDFLPRAVAAAQLMSADDVEPRWVRLQSGSFLPAGTLEANWRRLQAERADQERVWVLAGFETPPTAADKEHCEWAGVSVGWSLPGGVRLVRIDPVLDGESLRALGLRWVGGFYPEDKLPPRILHSGFGTWAVREDGWVALRVRYFPQLSEAQLRADLALLEVQVLWIRPETEAASIWLAPERLGELLAMDAIRWVEETPPDPVVFNDSARAIVGADVVQAAPYGLTGSGVMVGVCDEGLVSTNHLDFLGRLEPLKAAALSDHATHVAGTLGGSGEASVSKGGTALQWRGAAPGVRIGSFDFHDPIPPHQTLVERGGVISQNSWGWGINPNTCGLYGIYGNLASDFDRLVTGLYERPLSVVFAVGNLRTGTAPNSCLVGPYGTVGPPGTAKNVLSVGAVDSVTDAMTFFSGWGPLKDGRLKPELVAPGAQATDDGGVTSTVLGGGYGFKQGTSMAAPVVSGGMALLVEEYRALFGGQDPVPSVLRSLLIHTCQDLNDQTAHYQPGPDYASGYGRVRLVEAVEQLRSGGFLVGQVGHQGTREYRVEVPEGTGEVRYTLVWDDPPGLENAAVALVNDLDLVVWDPLGRRHYPWTLDPLNPSASAVRTQPDRRNVIEQVWVGEDVVAGTWVVQVVGTAIVEGDEQVFALAKTPSLPAIPPVLVLEAINVWESPDQHSNQNGFLEPGEGFLIQTAIHNRFVPSLASVTARLESDTLGVTILDGEVGYPPLPAGETVISSQPFRLRLAPELECGTVLTLRQVTEAGGSVFEDSFQIVVGNYVITDTGIRLVSSPDVPQAIPDGGGRAQAAESTILLDAVGRVESLAVRLRIDHPWSGDLGAELEHPDGTRVLLWPVTGVQGKDYGTGACDGEVAWTVLRDSATQYLKNAAAPFAESYRPEQPLGVLAGKPLQGTWTLRVWDSPDHDEGTLLCWGLEVTYEELGYVCEPFQPPPEALPQQVEVSFGLATLIQLEGWHPAGLPLEYALVTSPQHGTVIEFDPGTGQFVYLPNHGYAGPDAFSFSVADGARVSLPAWVSLVVLEAAADVGLEWVPGALLWGVGRDATADLVVTNRGPNTVHGLRVTVEWPAEATLRGLASDTGTVTMPASGKIVWAIDALPASEDLSLRLVLRVSQPGVYPVLAGAEFSELELQPADNDAVWEIDARPMTDLAVGISTAGDLVLSGGSGWVEVTVLNRGPLMAHDVVVEAELPSVLEWIDADVSRGEWVYADGIARWDIAELALNETLVWRWTVSGRTAGEGTVVVGVRAWEWDERAGDNLAAAELTVLPAADLAVGVDAPVPALLGQPTRVEIGVINRGPSTAAEVRVEGDLNLLWIDWLGQPEQGDWQLEPDRWVWTVGPLEPGQTRVLALSGLPSEIGRFVSRIVVASDLVDPSPSDNQVLLELDVLPAADLAVGFVGGGTQLPNLPRTVEVRVSNAGPSAANEVRVEGQPEDDWSEVMGEKEAGDWSVLPEGGWRWELAALPPGESAVLRLTLPGAALGDWLYEVDVSGMEVDPVLENNTAIWISRVRLDADLGIAAEVAPSSVSQGGEYQLSLTVSNRVGFTAHAVVVRVELPDGTEVRGVSGDGGTWVKAGTALRWELAELAVGEVKRLELGLAAMTPGWFESWVTVSAEEVELFPEDNAVSWQLSVEPAAELWWVLPEGGTRLLGTEWSETLVLGNNAAVDAVVVEVRGEVPEGLELVSIAADRGEAVIEESGGWRYELEVFAGGEEVTLELWWRAKAPGLWINRVELLAAEPLLVPGDRTGEWTVQVLPAADLKVESEFAARWQWGQTQRWTLRVANAGPSEAEGVLVGGALDALLELAEVGASVGEWTGLEEGRWEWRVGGLAPGADAVLWLDLRARGTGLTRNHVEVSSAVADPTPASNSLEVLSEIVAVADLWLAGTGDGVIRVGAQSGGQTWTVTNAGPHAATGVVVIGELDPGLSIVEGTVSQGSMGPTGEQWTWEVGGLEVGEGAVLTLVLEGLEVGFWSHTVAVSADQEEDPDPDNNRMTWVTSVRQATDLEISKSAATPTALLGSAVVYEIRAANLGPHPARNVRVYDALPEGLAFAGAIVTAGEVTHEAGEIEWVVAELGVDEQATLHLTTRAEALGLLTNRVQAAAEEFELVPENNAAEASVEILPAADLSVQGDSRVLVGQGATVLATVWVVNAGPSPATDLVVVGSGSEGASFVSGSSELGVWIPEEDGSWRWALGELAVGAEAALELSIAGMLEGDWLHALMVSASEADPNPGDNAAPMTIRVRLGADLAVGFVGGGTQLPNLLRKVEVRVSNAGPSAASEVRVEGRPENNWNVLAWETEAGVWSALDEGGWRWELAGLSAGASAVLQLTLPGAGLGDRLYAVEVSGLEVDPVLENNTASWVSRVRLDADLGIGAEVTPSSVSQGGEYQLSLTVSNRVGFTAHAVVVALELPDGTEVRGVSGDGGTWVKTGTALHWELAELAVDEVKRLELGLAAMTPGWFESWVTVSAEEVDLFPENNTVSWQLRVEPAAELWWVLPEGGTRLLGTEWSETLLLGNDVAVDAVEVEVRGEVAAGLELVSVAADRGVAVIDQSGGWSYSVEVLQSGEAVSLQLVWRAKAPGLWMNRVELLAAEPLLVPGDRTGEWTIQVVPAAELSLQADSIALLVQGGVPTAGEVVVLNHGPSVANEVVVTGSGSEGVLVVSASSDRGVWTSEGNGDWRWELDALAVGESVVLELSVLGLLDGSWTHALSVVAREADPNPDPNNNLILWTVEVLPAADLAVTLTGESAYLPGATRMFEVTVGNAGPSRSSGIAVFGAPEDDWEDASAETEAGVWTELIGGGWVWEVAELPAGETTLLKLTLPGREELGDWLHRVVVSGAEADPVPENNAAAWTSRVRLDADLAITAVVQPTSVLQGGDCQLSLVVTNHGGNTAYAVLVRGALPAGTEVRDVSGDGGTWTETDTGFHWELEELPAEFASQLNVTLRALNAGEHTSQVNVSAEEADPDLVNNVAFWTLTVEPGAELSWVLPGSGVRLLGQEWTETISLANAGPGDTQVIEIRGEVAAGLELVSVGADRGDIVAEQPGVWTYTLDNLAMDETSVIQLSLRAIALGTWVNRVELLTAGPAVRFEDRTGEWTIEVMPASDLSVAGSGASQLELGQQSTQEIVLANRGPSNATGVTVTGITGVGLRVLAAQATLGEFSGNEENWTWVVGGLPVGAEARLQVDVEAVATGDWISQAVATADQADPNATDNLAVWVSRVRPRSDLAVNASVRDGLVVVERPVTIEFEVTNHGPDTARGVQVASELPSGWQMNAGVIGQGSMAQTGGVWRWDIGELAAAAQATASITLLPSGVATTTVSVEVTADVLDPVLENNRSVLTLQVQPLADLRIVQSASTAQAMAGETFAYHLRVTNYAPYDAPAVTVKDFLPEGIEVLGSFSSQGTASLDGRVLTFELGVLPVGATATLDLTVRALQPGLLSNLAEVQSWVVHPDNPNLRAIATVQVIESAPLEIRLDEDRIELAWPADSEGYELYHTDSLREPVLWLTYPTPPSQVDDRFMITIKIVAQDRFYRLVKP